MNELKFAFRQIRRRPGFAAIAILTLALGIGVNTAMFSILNGMILRGLPSPEDHRMLTMYYTLPTSSDDERLGFSQLDYDEIRQQQRSFVDLAAYESRTTTIAPAGGDPERVDGTVMTSSAAAMLHAPLALGRWFNADEEKPGAAPTLVLSHALWKSRFGGQPGVLGQPVKLNGEWATVIGVAAPGFGFPFRSGAWYPPRDLHLGEKRDQRTYSIFGRLKPGVEVSAGLAELTALSQQAAAAHPETSQKLIPHADRLSTSFTDDTTRLLLSVMLAAVFFVLLIACGNVANLLLARAMARQKEMAVRAALGASRRQVARSLFSEAIVLVIGGSIAGLIIAYVGLALFRAYAVDARPPYWMTFELDWRSLLYTVGISVLACVLAGLYPTLRLSRPDLSTAINDASRGSTSLGLARFSRIMVIGEVALSCLLLVLSALTIRTVVKMHTAPLGFATENIYSGRVSLPNQTHREATAQREFFRQLLERIRERPEVASAGVCDLEVTWSTGNAIAIEGRPPAPKGQRGATASIRAISPGYLETLNIPLLRGRSFGEADTSESQPVALVSSAFAEKYWPGESALGKRLREDSGNPGDPPKWWTVVGVLGNTMQGSFDSTAAPQVYMPFTQREDLQRMTVFLRARAGDPAALAPVLRSTVRSLNEDLPVYFAQPLESTLTEARASKKLIAGLFGAFGVVAFILSAVGLYGVMSYSVSQRRQEIGVRVALGATPRHVLRMILRQGSWQLGLGLAIGIVLAAFCGQLLASILWGVTPRDFVSFGGTVLSLGVAGVIATLIPARRALRIDPAIVLRAD